MTVKSKSRNKHVLYVNRNTKVTADALQWIISFKRGKEWSAQSFISSTKACLLRSLDEADRVPDKRGARTLDRLPDTFAAWLAK